MQVGKKSSNQMSSWQALTASTLFVSFFVIWFLWGALDWPSLSVLLKSKDAASWVQAVGSLILVGVTVFIFYIGEEGRKRDKKEDKAKDIDEARIYILSNSNLFSSIEFFLELDDIYQYSGKRVGSPNNIYYYPALNYFLIYKDAVQELNWMYEEFLQMQVPMGVPKLCVVHVYEQYKIIKQINGIFRDDRSFMHELLAIKKRGVRIFDDFELNFISEMDKEFGYSIMYLKKFINDLRLANHKMKQDIFSGD